MPTFKLKTVEKRADFKHVLVEPRVVIDLDKGLMLLHYGRHADGEAPTESIPISVTLSKAGLDTVLALVLAEAKGLPEVAKG